MIDRLIFSMLYAEINGLVNPKNKRLITFLLVIIPDGGNTSPCSGEF
jgi:hypothetical protein